jgi:hypothetical protein
MVYSQISLDEWNLHITCCCPTLNIKRAGLTQPKRTATRGQPSAADKYLSLIYCTKKQK